MVERLVTMNLVNRLLTLCVLGLLAAVPFSAAQTELEPGIYNPTETSTEATMYFHVNGIQDFPVNTQIPDDRYQQSTPLGLTTHSQGCQDVPDLALVSNTHHTYYGYSSPGYVEYDVDEGGKPRYHTERGISFDVKLDRAVDAEVLWYMESQVVGGDTQPFNVNTIPAVIPNVVVRATVREGDQISVGHEEMNTGAVIAEGFTTATTLAGPQTTYPEDGSVFAAGTNSETGAAVYGFKVTAPIDKAIINKDESYNVRIDVFMEGVGCDDPAADQYFMADWVRVHTSPENRPQLKWNILNPLRIEFLHPQFIGDDLVVHTSTNSPWGNYDVRGDQASESAGQLEVSISGPSVPVSFERVALTARTHEHDHHTEAVDATWVWQYKKDGAEDGLYTVHMVAQNDQLNAVAEAVAQFEVGTGVVHGCGGQEKGGGSDDCFTDTQPDGNTGTLEESPGVGTLVLLGTLAALGVALRRRE